MKIALLGDIGLLGNYSLSNNQNLINKLDAISEFLKQFDLVVGNLETPFSYKKKTWGAKSAYICTDTINIDVLKALHIDAVTLANNHMYDFGKEGFDTTIKLLDEAKIAWFGANGKDLKIDVDGNKIVFNGFCCYSTNPLKIARKYGDYGINRFDLAEAANILKENAADEWLNIFAIHSGIEHVNTPSIQQIYASRELSKIAPYIWYGHHPHVVQGIEKCGDSLIAHSLGNFSFAGNTEDKNRPVIELTDNNRMGMILVLDVVNNELVGHQDFLTHIGEDGEIRILDNVAALDDYSSKIKLADSNPAEYTETRRAQRGVYLARRKSMRNFGWVLKRLRPRYVRLMLDNRSNSKKYFTSVLAYLKQRGYEL
jgi:poly-gamma-glutamate synthesis protein (capsule biosynthesis protein)